MHNARTMDEVMLDEHMLALMANRYSLAIKARDYCDLVADMGIMLTRVECPEPMCLRCVERLDAWLGQYDLLPDVERAYTRARIVKYTSEVEAMFLINGHH